MGAITETGIFKLHVERLKAATLNRFNVDDIPAWICKHTQIAGSPYSFKDHEYQEVVLRDTSQEVVVKKPSQVGLSETSARLALALCAVLRHYTVAYTLPTAGFAATFMRTRIDPIIQNSPYLAALIHTATDNSEVKHLGDSFLFLKGAQSSNAPISVPCDHLIHDEVDFSDPEVLSQYQSRLTHSKYKKKTKLSTPTLPDRGIDKEFKRSRRHFNLIKCNHCNHWFMPDYFAHVRMPGYSDDLRLITKTNLHKYDYRSAAVHCPQCGGKPSLQPEHREWVRENTDENHVAAGYQVTPFDAPNIISAGYLIEASTQYKRYIDFINFGLGLAAEDKEATLTDGDMENCLVPAQALGYGGYVMGLDMGLLCHCKIGFCTHDGFLIIVHSEIIPVHKVRIRRKELAVEYRVRMTVVDSQPYTETVLTMQAEDANLYGAVYIRSKNIETHSVRQKEEDKEEGQIEVRQVSINRDKALDAYMEAIRSGFIKKIKDENDEVWKTQHCDMKRVREWTPDAELSFVWRKSEDGNDHFHHAGVYLWIASQMLGVSRGAILIPATVMISKFKVKTAV